MKDYSFDYLFLSIVEKCDMGWSIIMTKDPLTSYGIFSDFENLGFSL